MPTLALEPDKVEANPFGDLIPDDSEATGTKLIGGGTPAADATQVVNGRSAPVPKAVAVSTAADRFGPFSDLVSDESIRKPGSQEGDFGLFSDLIPKSPTSESERALAETPMEQEEQSTLADTEAATPEKQTDTGAVHQTLNAVRVFGSAAGRYLFDGLERLSAAAKDSDKKLDEIVMAGAPPEIQKQMDDRLHGEIASYDPVTQFFKNRAEAVAKESGVDPNLAQTVPARLAHEAGTATIAGMESLIPGAGLPLMTMHGALSAEQEALNQGRTPEHAEEAGVRSAIGLGLMGGASKAASLGTAALVGKDASTMTKFLTQFVGQDAANETSSAAMNAWQAAENAQPGEKLHAALSAIVPFQNLESSTLNAVYAGMHAANVAGARGDHLEAMKPGGEALPSTRIATTVDLTQPYSTARTHVVSDTPTGEAQASGTGQSDVTQDVATSLKPETARFVPEHALAYVDADGRDGILHATSDDMHSAATHIQDTGGEVHAIDGRILNEPVTDRINRIITTEGGEIPNATQERQQPQNGEQQHQDGNEGGQTAEAGRGDSAEQSGQEQQASEVGARTITPTDFGAMIREHDNNLWAASDALAAEVQQHLNNGGAVTITVDGKRVPIVSAEGGRLRDAEGQQWGTMSLATGISGVQNNVEFHPSEAQPEATTDGIYPKTEARSGNPNFAVDPAELGVAHPLPKFIQHLADAVGGGQMATGLRNRFKALIDAAGNKMFPKTTIADRPSGELAARWVSSKTAAPHVSNVFAAHVLEGTEIDPTHFGAALTEDNLRSIRADAEARAKELTGKGDTTGAALAQADADRVTTLIGAKGSPFKNEKQYQAFLADPAVQKAIERHRSLWAETVDPMHKTAQELDPDEQLPARGLQTGARVNLFAMHDLEGEPAQKDNFVQSVGTGNLTGTMRKRSPFGMRAKGTGEAYNTNYFDMMANTFGRQIELSNKTKFENQLVQSGNAVIGNAGERPVLADGEETIGFPLKRGVTPVFENAAGEPMVKRINRYLYVRKSLAPEYRRAANVDQTQVPLAMRGLTFATNKAALAGLTDASVHVMNLGTALFTRPSVAGGVLGDTFLSLFGRADVPATLVKLAVKATRDNRTQLASLAEIGAMKGQVPGAKQNWRGNLINWMDKNSRLMLDDAYQSMVKSKLVPDNETNRREFVNQIGQYNKRAQNALVKLGRDAGLAPFATAGTTFNNLGVRTALLSPGVKAASLPAALVLRANVLSKWVGAIGVLVPTANYLITGSLMGRPGTPIGSIDTGRDDENGRPLSYSVINILGLGRAMRVTGVRGAAEAYRKGLPASDIRDAAYRDVFNSWVSPFTGPTPRFAAGLANLPTGIGLGKPHPIVAPGENQFESNAISSVIEANPIAASVAGPAARRLEEMGLPVPKVLVNRQATEGTVGDAVRRQLPRLSLQPTQPADFIENYPEIVTKAQSRAFIDDVIHRARYMQDDQREKFIDSALDRLPDEERAHAVRTIRYARVAY